MSEEKYQQVKRILILSANPRSTSKLRLDEEMREIKEGLRRSKKRDQYSINTVEAARYRDIYRAILDYEPQIVHFSGHGAGEEGLAFENEVGQVQLVDAKAIAGLFELFADQVKCVVLNACYSKVQAEEIARHINYVVGMSKAINDRAAIEFAVGFYDALGAGRSVEFAYKLGCSAIHTAGIEEYLTPVLKKKLGMAAREIDTFNNMSNIHNSFNQRKIERLQRDIDLAQKQSDDLTELINVIADEIDETRGDSVRQRNLNKRKTRYEKERNQYDEKIEKLQVEISQRTNG